MSSICISTSSAALALLLLPGPAPPVPDAAQKIIEGARIQAREGASYSPGYFKIGYPNGDLPRDKGVCTDVVVRALRHAGYDLQRLIHEDMRANFSKYPQRYGAKRPDTNIDHRRVPNQMTFFKRKGTSLRLNGDWKPGDIVYWKLPSGLDHCGVLTSRKGRSGNYLVVHNLSKCVEEDCLENYKITGHFRYP